MKLRITVHGVAYEVDVEVLDPGEGFAPHSPLPPVRPPAERPGEAPGNRPGEDRPPPPSTGGPAAPATARSGSVRTVASPIAGTVLEVKCRSGDAVREGEILLVIEAMKMKTSIAAPAGGRIKRVAAAAGDAVREGDVLVEFE